MTAPRIHSIYRTYGEDDGYSNVTCELEVRIDFTVTWGHGMMPDCPACPPEAHYVGAAAEVHDGTFTPLAVLGEPYLSKLEYWAVEWLAEHQDEALDVAREAA